MPTRKRSFLETSSSTVCKGESTESTKQMKLDDDLVSEECTSKASVVTSEALGTEQSADPVKMAQNLVQDSQDNIVQSNQGSSFSTLSSSESSSSNNQEIAGGPNATTASSALP